jgi:hypothetical protein
MPLNEISDDSTSISSEELRAVRYQTRRTYLEPLFVKILWAVRYQTRTTLKLTLSVALCVAAIGALSVSRYFLHRKNIGSLHSFSSVLGTSHVGKDGGETSLEARLTGSVMKGDTYIRDTLAGPTETAQAGNSTGTIPARMYTKFRRCRNEFRAADGTSRPR